jgi:hypothetical protein
VNVGSVVIVKLGMRVNRILGWTTPIWSISVLSCLLYSKGLWDRVNDLKQGQRLPSNWEGFKTNKSKGTRNFSLCLPQAPQTDSMLGDGGICPLTPIHGTNWGEWSALLPGKGSQVATIQEMGTPGTSLMYLSVWRRSNIDVAKFCRKTCLLLSHSVSKTPAFRKSSSCLIQAKDLEVRVYLILSYRRRSSFMVQ